MSDPQNETMTVNAMMMRVKAGAHKRVHLVARGALKRYARSKALCGVMVPTRKMQLLPERKWRPSCARCAESKAWERYCVLLQPPRRVTAKVAKATAMMMATTGGAGRGRPTQVHLIWKRDAGRNERDGYRLLLAVCGADLTIPLHAPAVTAIPDPLDEWEPKCVQCRRSDAWASFLSLQGRGR